MKIVDEQGRLFGKINIIDFFIVAFVAVAAIMFYAGYKKISQKPSAPKVDEVLNIEIYGKFIKIPPDTLARISVGNKEIDDSGKAIGEIIWLGQARPYRYALDLGENKIILVKDSLLEELPVKLSLKAELIAGALYYKNIPIRVNSAINIDTGKYSVTFIVLPELELGKAIAGIDVENLEFSVMFNGISEDIARMIQVGDKELSKDGSVLAEVLDVGAVGDSNIKINLGNNNFVYGIDRNKKQVSARIRLRCEIGDAGYMYYKNQRLTNDSVIEFKTDKYRISGAVNSFGSEERWVRLQVKFTALIPELANLVKVDDIERGSDGRMKGVIKEILDNKPSDTYVFTMQDNKFISVANPFHRDVIVVLDVICNEKDGNLYFKNSFVKVGSMITFTTDKYSVAGTIVGSK